MGVSQLPQGYWSAPVDYKGQLFLESQMKAHSAHCVAEALEAVAKELETTPGSFGKFHAAFLVRNFK